MRHARRSLVLLVPLALAACDDKPVPAPAATTAAAPSAAPTESAPPAATATARAPAIPMPPRPVPIGSSGPIQPSAPPEQQMMAIAYTLALVTPRDNDPLTVDKGYLDEMVPKLAGIIAGVDKGKTPPNPVQTNKGNRKLEINMGKGCTDRMPGLLVQRAGTTLKAAFDAGVLVIACHDDKWECHQSTRNPADVLCHAAPRH